MKDTKLSKHESYILDILVAIKEKRFYGIIDDNSVRDRSRISRHDLCSQLGYADSKNRSAIHGLRKKGYPVCSDLKGGYWLGTSEEWDVFRTSERQIALSRMYPALRSEEDI